MKLIAVPDQERALTLQGFFRVIGFPLGENTNGSHMPGDAEIIMQLSEAGPGKGGWVRLLWEFAYDSDVVNLKGSKRRGSCIYVEHVDHRLTDSPYGVSVFRTLFWEKESRAA